MGGANAENAKGLPLYLTSERAGFPSTDIYCKPEVSIFISVFYTCLQNRHDFDYFTNYFNIKIQYIRMIHIIYMILTQKILM